jgi:mRNA interferase HigB
MLQEIAASRLPFAEWLTKLKHADWEKPTDIQSTFGSADLLGKSSGRIVFNIGGNNYRMICKYAFGHRSFIRLLDWNTCRIR